MISGTTDFDWSAMNMGEVAGLRELLTAANDVPSESTDFAWNQFKLTFSGRQDDSEHFRQRRDEMRRSAIQTPDQP
jgi:hypothetical protein